MSEFRPPSRGEVARHTSNNERANHLCASPGCGDAGTMTHSISHRNSGDVSWYCWRHFHYGPEKAQKDEGLQQVGKLL